MNQRLAFFIAWFCGMSLVIIALAVGSRNGNPTVPPPTSTAAAAITSPLTTTATLSDTAAITVTVSATLTPIP